MKPGLFIAFVLVCAATQQSAAQTSTQAPNAGASRPPQSEPAPQVPPPAAPAPPAAATTTTKPWNAVAGGIWRVRGVVQVAIGYSGTRYSAAEATASAENQCRSAGGRNCKATGAWDYGCIYITTGRNRRGTAGWTAAATSDDTMKSCRDKGYTNCKPPIGGCVE